MWECNGHGWCGTQISEALRKFGLKSSEGCFLAALFDADEAKVLTHPKESLPVGPGALTGPFISVKIAQLRTLVNGTEVELETFKRHTDMDQVIQVQPTPGSI